MIEAYVIWKCIIVYKTQYLEVTAQENKDSHLVTMGQQSWWLYSEVVAEPAPKLKLLALCPDGFSSYYKHLTQLSWDDFPTLKSVNHKCNVSIFTLSFNSLLVLAKNK